MPERHKTNVRERPEYSRRACCGTTYSHFHLDNCPERGIDARAALSCSLSADGWCESHSTGAGPVYCESAGPSTNTPTPATTEENPDD